MDTSDLKEQLAKLDEQIDALPCGSISAKKVNGHTYYYHRWYEGKTKKERFIPEEELEQLRALIGQRKELQAQRKELKKQCPKGCSTRTTPPSRSGSEVFFLFKLSNNCFFNLSIILTREMLQHPDTSPSAHQGTP